MTRNCNLQLGLTPSSGCLCFTVSPSLSLETSQYGDGERSGEQLEQMVIFYNGKICVCDVTELQARSIIWHANRRMEEEMTRHQKGEQPQLAGSYRQISPTSLPSHQLYCSTGTGLSMKRSLRQFLEKRRHRIQATSPYISQTNN